MRGAKCHGIQATSSHKLLLLITLPLISRDEIVPKIEASDNEHHSESDKDYLEKEKDIIDDDHDSEGRPGDKEDDDQIVRYERMAEDAPPHNNDYDTEDVPPTDAPTSTISVDSKKTKGRGPTKNLKVIDPMHLEYNAVDQTCGKWRRQYEKQVGLCIRKISILYAWNEVPEGLKNSLWDDTVNLFQIENNEEKKNVFLSAVAKRFKNFKSKLVTGWITKKRARKTKKVKTGKKGGDQAPSKTTSSTAISAFVNTPTRDASGKFTIIDPKTKKVVDAVLEGKKPTGKFTPRGNVDALHMVLGKDHRGRVVRKEGVRVGLKKAFGKECVATQSRTMPLDEVATLRAQTTKDVLAKVAFVLQKMGAPTVDLANMIVEDQQSQHGDPKASVERIHEPTPEPITPVALQPITIPEAQNPKPETINSVAQNPEPTPEPVVKEATPCSLLVPQLGVTNGGDLTEVAYGMAQPTKEGQTVYSMPITGGHISVTVETIVKGFEDFSLPIPMPE
ncbi:uncharacterized protein LOC130806439 isoform X2 [Amaranthus tricolor]|uniref:uncharacterized protein LOC130806439 isoform X2 n=1 Tax=Amaranthus tricolor TaxID=29722 RepID=UPI00258E15C5|nr:uncharacterized protein LOC130806439 isoform X2 [Amaranthus tricolor]